MPILVITGGRDPTSKAKMGDELVNNLANARHLHYPSAGHLVMAELPELVNSAIASWLNLSSS